MSDDLSQELRAFEGSDALGAGDFSVCIRGADRIEAQAARIAELEAALRDITARLLETFPGLKDLPPIQKARAALAGSTK